MAVKFVALLLFVCAAQAQIFGRFPMHVSHESSTSEDQVAKPMGHFAAQISKIHETFHNFVPAIFHADKNKPQVTAHQNPDIQHARNCAEAAQPDLTKLAETAQTLLVQSVRDLVGETDEDMELKTQEAVQTVQQAVEEVQALISQGKLLAARDRLNEGRKELDAQVNEIFKYVGEKYPDLDSEAANMNQHFYNVTFSGATALFQKIQECMKNGKN